MTGRRPGRDARCALLAALLLTACSAGRPGLAGVPGHGDGPSSAAQGALDALLLGAPAEAAPRAEAALARSPQDPWAHLAAALLARRALDGEAEVPQLAAAVAAGPDHPVALVALRRLSELPEGSPELARAVEAALATLAGSGPGGVRLAGLAAARARVARIAAAEALGDLDAVARLRAENGAATAWTVAGPFGALHAFDFERRFAPEEGTLPAEVPAPWLGAPRPTRAVPAPDGALSLEAEPSDGDVFYLAADATAARGGRYLLVAGAGVSLRIWIDGAPVVERRAFSRFEPALLVRPVELPPGPHLVLVKLARGGVRGVLPLSLTRADGAPSDVAWAARPAGPLPATRDGAWPTSAFGARDLAEALAPAGLAASRLLAARDAVGGDLEGAKALLEEALARAPRSAPLLAARGEVASLDGTLDDQIGRSRAEAALRGALAVDPGDGEARLALAELARKADRAVEAEATLAALPPALARRPAALAARARVALDRGLAEEAEGLAQDARAAGGSCEALRLLADQAARRDARAAEEEAVRALGGCAGGRDRLVRLLEQRGRPDEALALMAPAARVRPASVSAGLRRATLLAARGDPAAAARELSPLLGWWPRHPPLLKAAAQQLELAGDPAGARALRERALLVDGGDLALRRALALQDGHDLLDEGAEDGPALVRAYLARQGGRREEAGSVLVLDAAAVEFHPGGAVTSRVHQVVRVLEQEAVDQWGELSPPSGAQVLVMRTLKPDGGVLEPEGAEGKGAHSLSGLEPGDFVDFEFLISSRPASGRQGLSAEAFYFATPGTAMVRSTYLVLAPHALGVTLDAHGLPPPSPRTEGGLDRWRVERTDVPALIAEPGAPSGPEFLPFVQAGVGGGREAVQLSLADGTLDRAAPTLELRALAAAVRQAAGAAAGPEALARAAYAAVRERVVGQGGGLGEDAAAVLSRGRGSRLVLLRAVLDLLGVPARYAVLRPESADATAYRFPGAGLWSTAVLRVRWPGGTLWLDPSVRQQPFGELPDRALGAEALVLPLPGEPPELDRTPASSGRREGRELEVSATLAADGSAEVSGVDRYQGSLGAASKAAFERLDERSRRQAVEQLLSRSIRGFQVGEVSIEGEDDPEAPLVIRWKGRTPTLAREAADALLVELPLTQARLGARLAQRAVRTTPLLLEANERSALRLVVTPPPGAGPRPGPAERRASPAGSFTHEERVEGGALVREDVLELRRGRIPAAEAPAMAAFAGAVDAIQARPLVFGRSVAAAGGDSPAGRDRPEPPPGK